MVTLRDIGRFVVLMVWCTLSMHATTLNAQETIAMGSLPTSNVTTLTSHRLLAGLTTQSLYDGYLSSVPYKGWGFYLNHTALNPFSAKRNHWMVYQQTEALVASATNEAGTASLSRLNLSYVVGGLYAFKPVYGLKVAAGPLFGADVGMKQLPRNVNNPYNMNLGVDLMLGATLTYDLKVFKRMWRLKADLKSPLLGCFVAPVRGQSYYEWLTYNQHDEVFHLSSLHNKNALSMLYTLDIPLGWTVFSLGVSGQMAARETTDMVFKEQGWGVMAGCSFDLAAFAGYPFKTRPGYVRVDR
ncbi:MAG: hypothetical protein BWY72_00880 [Bacteroidetes bacterium ADurb.Bin416]|nr:MAG: hypothetical protein BWY72_00880 [Bacteroidetes bacterium ADurb.Bin416]